MVLLLLLVSCLKIMARAAQAILGETSFGWIWSRGQNTEETWALDDLTELLIVLYSVSLTSELPVPWDNSVPCCVSQCDLGFGHMQPKAFWVIYSLCPEQIHVRWIWLYPDNIGRSSLPCHEVGADSDWLMSVFSQGLYLRPGFFKKAARNQPVPIFFWSLLDCSDIRWCHCSWLFLPSFPDSDSLLWSQSLLLHILHLISGLKIV